MIGLVILRVCLINSFMYFIIYKNFLFKEGFDISV